LELIDIEIYRLADSDYFDLPNGQIVQGENAVLDALGIELN
jgi:hypothetical protein